MSVLYLAPEALQPVGLLLLVVRPVVVRVLLITHTHSASPCETKTKITHTKLTGTHAHISYDSTEGERPSLAHSPRLNPQFGTEKSQFETEKSQLRTE